MNGCKICYLLTYLGVLLFTDRFLISDPHERRQKIYDELPSLSTFNAAKQMDL